VEGFGEAALGALSNDCRLSRTVAPSFLQLVPHRLLIASPLIMLVYRASTNCPTLGLFLEPQYKQIAPNVFLRVS
jgi:hypothetical protein